MDSEEFRDLRLRPEIEQSWTRSSICGLSASTVHHDTDLDVDVDVDSRLARAAFPVIDRLCEQINGGRVAFMLIDKSATLIKTARADNALERAMYGIGAVVGTTWSEERTGTNALATPFETKQPIFIHGHEHFIEPMKDFSCYGAPIFHPITGRLEGVLDIMADSAAESPLMIPVVDRAVAQIQEGLRSGHTRSATTLLASFEATAGASSHPVVAIGPTIVLQSAKASQILAAADLEHLRAVATDRNRGRRTSDIPITLQNGLSASVNIEDVSSSAGAVLTIQVQDRPHIPRNAAARNPFQEINTQAASLRNGTGSLLIVGESGSGRSALAHAAAGFDNMLEIHPLQKTEGETEEEIEHYLHNMTHGILLVEDIEMLSARAKTLLSAAARTSTARIIATADETRLDQISHLVARFTHRIDVRPLREVRHDLAEVIRAIRPNGPRFQFDSAAIRVLTSYAWPGNLVELSHILDTLAERAEKQVICLSDLPLHLRRSGTKSLTPWQRAARDAITYALEVKHDNKSHAADFLGISRTSLYHHMREYGLL